MHTEQYGNAKTSEEMWDSPLTLVAALDANGSAEGTLVVVSFQFFFFSFSHCAFDFYVFFLFSFFFF
jgi:hypothetical protein